MAANEHQQKDEEDGSEPAHHARRPMNAFLIFCKRHRAAVRTAFPHLENRAVTRVLGEWWAMLSTEQKEAYTNLAQEYKDAFLNANPDFKWYKLPAPPLRTLNTRPTNKKLESEDVVILESLHFVSSKLDEEEAIQPGKLADESQIGGLSSLFTPEKAAAGSNLPQDSDSDDDEGKEVVPKPPKKRYIDLPPISSHLKDECKADLFGTGQKSNLVGAGDTYIEDASMGEDHNTFRGERSCKGLRYQKFLAEQKQRRISGLPIADQQRSRERRNSLSSNISEKTDSLSSEGTSSRGDLEHLVEGAEGHLEASKPEDTETEGAEGNGIPWNCRKRFKAEDFNLEKKIEALPSLSLEEFQAMKKQQRTKKKKVMQKVVGTSSAKRQQDNSSTQSSKKSDSLLKKEMQEKHAAALLVGSQKRKARKQSITRNTETMDSQNLDAAGTSKAWCESPGLEALACLATVAANRTKLTKS